MQFKFSSFEKPFDRVSRGAVGWALRKVGLEKWFVRFVQSVYSNARTGVQCPLPSSRRITTSMLSFLLFTAVLKVLSRAVRPGFLDELLYVHDLTVISEKGKLKAWTVALESNRLSINANKTKI